MKRYTKILLGVVVWAVLMLGCVCTARADKTIKSAYASREGTSQNGKVYSVSCQNSGDLANNVTKVSVVVSKIDLAEEDFQPGEWANKITADPLQHIELDMNSFSTSGTASFTLKKTITGIWGTDFHVYLVTGDVNDSNAMDRNYANERVEIEFKNTILSVPVTFKVVGGAWDDGDTTDKTVMLSRRDDEDKVLVLTDRDIPAVGNKPADGFKAGAWDVPPSTDMAINEAKTYTYTYEEKPKISATVNFKVVNGSWDDGTTAEKTVTLTGHEGDTLKLAASQIPAVGNKPKESFKAGSWDTVPTTSLSFADGSNMTFTYTYAQKQQITDTVMFRVVNGSWDDGTTADKQVTLSGDEGSILYLEAGQIPSAGSRPNSGFKAGSWDAVPSTQSPITRDESFTYTYAAEPAPAPAPEPTPAPSPNIEEPITVPKAPAYVRAKGKKAKVIVTWRKIKKTTKTKALRAMIQGIQVQAATDPDFKNIVKTVSIEKNKTKVKLKLPGQTSYYVRVRYVGADGVSAWSKVKKATTK